MVTTLTLKRNFAYNIPITVRYKDGTPYNLTGKTLWVTVKKYLDDDLTNAEAKFIITVTSHSNPSLGQSVIPITQADTLNLQEGKYFIDYQVGTSTADRIATDAEELICERAVKN